MERQLVMEGKRKALLAIVITLFVAIPIIIAIVFGNPSQPLADDTRQQTVQPEADPAIKFPSISNYNEYVRNLSSEERSLLESALYNVIVFNLRGTDPMNISDIQIRKDSYRQELVSPDLYITEFIVDIASIKQSYRVWDAYSLAGSGAYMGEYPQLILCPTAEELIYGDFDCKDAISMEEGTGQ
jgi:hypothetical protein